MTLSTKSNHQNIVSSFQIRAETRAKIGNNGEREENEILKSALKLLSLDTNSDFYYEELTNFLAHLENSNLNDIESLQSLNFDKYLISIISIYSNLQPIILQRCLRCVSTWIQKFPKNSSAFFTAELIVICTNIILNCQQEFDPKTCFYALVLMKILCSISLECISFLVLNNYLQCLVNFYISCFEYNIRKEILCVLYFVSKSKPTNFEILSECGKIFTELVSNPSDPNLAAIFSLASSFAECGDAYCFLVCDCLPFDSLFSSFSNFSNDEQGNFLRLLISTFESNNQNCIIIIRDMFKWEIINPIVLGQNNDLTKEYFAKMLCSAFSKSQQMIINATKNDVFQILLRWIELEHYQIKHFAMIAILRAITGNIEFAGIMLFNAGVLNCIMSFFECNSKVLIREICLMALELFNFASKLAKNELCQILSQVNITEILTEVDGSVYGEIPNDLIEILKDSLDEIQSRQLWL